MHSRIGDSRISHFKITLSGGRHFSNKLYANGRHQCEVLIEVAKEVLGEDNIWCSAALTPGERESVTIVNAVEGPEPTLSAGWHCDDEPGGYAMGLWEHTGLDPLEAEQEGVFPPSGCEVVRRYLRVDSEASIGPATFLARIIVGSEYLTTDFPAGTSITKSLITVTPHKPFKLHANDFTRYVDYGAYVGDPEEGGRVTVAVFYWVPPDGVEFVKNVSLANPVPIAFEGDHFKTSYVNKSFGISRGSRAGIVLNKDNAGARLYMTDITKVNMGLPEPNPEIQFNKYPTIVRVVSIFSALSIGSADTRSRWTLLDNYGNEHGFILDVAASGDVTLKAVETVRITRMRIVLPNGQSSTSELYANDRHQCKVQIEVLAERENSDGYWEPITLSKEERDSVTVTRYSANPREPLPPGWSCDRDKNIYDTGLWSRGAVIHSPEQNDGPAEMTAGVLNEVIDRYMRFNSTTAIESHRFMATIQLGGKIFSTNPSSVGQDSSINILPIRPYVLKVADLVEYHDISAQSDSYTDVDVYYYSTPSGLKIVSSRGLDNPLLVQNEGDYFQTSFCQEINDSGFRWCKAGVVISKDVPGLQLRTQDVHRGSNPLNPYVEFNKISTIFRAVKLWSKSSITTGNTSSKWRVWDNYGCEHVFFMAPADSGRRIELRNG